MGLLRALLLPILTPVDAVVAVADRLAAEAERQLYDDDALRAQLDSLAAAHDSGQISDADYDAVEEQLLRRMQHMTQRLDGEGA